MTFTGKTKEQNQDQVDELEYQLDAAEEELDMAYNQLSDELSKKDEMKKSKIELQKNILTNPATIKLIRKSMEVKTNMSYGELLGEWGFYFSSEKLERFKELIVDRYMVYYELSPKIMTASTDEEKKDLQMRYDNLREEIDANINELIGDEYYEKYQEYDDLSNTRYVINGFKRTLNRNIWMTRAQEQELLEIMHREEEKVYSEIGYDPNKTIRFPSDMNAGKIAEILNNSEKIHSRTIEGVSGTFTVSQLEQLKEYFKSQDEMLEISLMFNQ